MWDEHEGDAQLVVDLLQNVCVWLSVTIDRPLPRSHYELVVG